MGKDIVVSCTEGSLDRINITFNRLEADNIDTKVCNVVEPFYLPIRLPISRGES